MSSAHRQYADRLRSWSALLLLLVLALPALEMFRIALSRFAFPYELEWLEGESAMQAWRFSQDPGLDTLYPRYGEGAHTPHLYTPLYHMLFGVAIKLTGAMHLGLGRGISLLSTVLLMAGVFLIVRERTRDWKPAAAGALAYAWFYLPSGFWYDLARVDSLAWCLAVWSCWALSRRRGGAGWMVLGAVLGALAYLAKQTAFVLPLALIASRTFMELVNMGAAFRWGGRVLRRETIAVLCSVVAAGAAAGMLALVIGSDRFENMRFYTVVVPENHGLLWEYLPREGAKQVWNYTPWWTLPAGVGGLLLLFARASSWRRATPSLIAAAVCAAAALGFWWFGRGLERPPMSWVGDEGGSIVGPHALAYVAGSWSPAAAAGWALLAGAFGAALGRRLTGARWLPGVKWLLVAGMVQHLTAVSFTKVGAYVNNLMPLWVVLSIVFGFGVAWLGTAAARIEARHAEFSRHYGWIALACIAATAWFLGGFRHDRSDIYLKPQIPSERTLEVWNLRRDRIATLDADGMVYSPNHNFVNLLAGAYTGQSIDAIRDVYFLGPPTPDSLLDDLRGGRWKYVVTSFRVEGAPLPPDFTEALLEGYRYAGQLLTEDMRREDDDLWTGPRIGSFYEPEHIYKRTAEPEGPAVDANSTDD